MRGKKTDYTGYSTGRITVIKYSHRDKAGNCIWLCKCECGNVFLKPARLIRKVTGTGCNKCQNITHGLSTSRIHRIWTGIKTRTSPNNSEKYPHYSGRGITHCKEWDQFEPFYEWAMANGYSDNLSIDRIDVNGNYEPSNCRWVTMAEQAKNKTTNRHLIINGENKTITEWSKITGIDIATISWRIKQGRNNEEALTKLKKTIKVSMVDHDEKVIKTYNSMSEAERENGISKGKISEVVSGNRKTAGGYKWILA
jgi:hypothetical protein